MGSIWDPIWGPVPAHPLEGSPLVVYTTTGACPYKGMWYQDITTLETTRDGYGIGVQNGTPRSGTTVHVEHWMHL